MNYMKILRAAVPFLLISLTTSCVTKDYDEELNDAEQERIRLHQEDQNIYDEITTAAHSLDCLIDEMAARVRGELSAKETELANAISEGERLVNEYFEAKLGDADGLVDEYDSNMRRLIQSKNDEFETARQTLENAMRTLAQQGYEGNMAKMQEGIDLLDGFQSQYDNAVGKMRERIEALQQMQQRLSTLQAQYDANVQKREQQLAELAKLQNTMKQRIQEGINEAKTDPAHTAALRELQASYAQLVDAMKALADAYSYDNTWTGTADLFAQDIQSMIADAEDAISKGDDLGALIAQFEAGTADDILASLTDIKDDLDALVGSVDEDAMNQAASEAFDLQGLMDGINTAQGRIDDALQRCDDALADSDWESWKS